MAYVPRYGYTSNRSLVDLKHMDVDSPDYARVVEAIERQYPMPARVTEADQEEFDKQLDYLLEYGRGTRLKRALEALDPDIFGTFLRRVVHIKVLDGFADPAYQNWRPLVDQVSFTDFEQNESVRFENPADLVRKQTMRVGPDFEELEEFTMPTWRGAVYSTGFTIPFETTRIENLAQRLVSIFNNGTAANRTIEKFVFTTLIEGNPSITVDDTSQSLFANTHTSGTDNDLNGGVTAFSIAQLEAIITLMSNQTIDGEVMALVPRYLVVKRNSANHFRMMEVLQSITRPALSATDVEAGNIFVSSRGNFPLEIIATEVLNANSWFAVADPASAPATAIELGFLDGRDTPELIDIDKQSSVDFETTGDNRWLLRMGFGGTARDFRGWYRGSPTA